MSMFECTLILIENMATDCRHTFDKLRCRVERERERKQKTTLLESCRNKAQQF